MRLSQLGSANCSRLMSFFCETKDDYWDIFGSQLAKLVLHDKLANIAGTSDRRPDGYFWRNHLRRNPLRVYLPTPKWLASFSRTNDAGNYPSWNFRIWILQPHSALRKATPFWNRIFSRRGRSSRTLPLHVSWAYEPFSAVSYTHLTLPTKRIV